MEWRSLPLSLRTGCGKKKWKNKPKVGGPSIWSALVAQVSPTYTMARQSMGSHRHMIVASHMKSVQGHARYDQADQIRTTIFSCTVREEMHFWIRIASHPRPNQAVPDFRKQLRPLALIIFCVQSQVVSGPWKIREEKEREPPRHPICLKANGTWRYYWQEEKKKKSLPHHTPSASLYSAPSRTPVERSVACEC